MKPHPLAPPEDVRVSLGPARWLPPLLAEHPERGARLLGILEVLCDGPIALSALARALGGACQDPETLQGDLEALQNAQFVKRTVWSKRPPKWSYELSGRGEAVRGEVRALIGRSGHAWP